MPFVNSYTASGPACFRRIAFASFTEVVAIGRMGTQGLVARIRADGSVVWSKVYDVAEFVDITFLERHIVLLARTNPATAALGYPNALVRIDEDGNIVWARRLAEQGRPIRVLGRFLGAPSELLLVVLDVPRTAATYGGPAADLLLCDSWQGTTISTQRLSVPGGGRILGATAVPDPEGFVLVGDAGALTAAQWEADDPVAEFGILGAHGLVVHVDVALTSATSSFFCSEMTLHAVNRYGPHLYAVAGATKTSIGTVRQVATTLRMDYAPDLWFFEGANPDMRPVRSAEAISGIDAAVLLGNHPGMGAAASQVWCLLNGWMEVKSAHGFNFDAGAEIHGLAVLVPDDSQVVVSGAIGQSALVAWRDSSLDSCCTHTIGIQQNNSFDSGAYSPTIEMAVATLSPNTGSTSSFAVSAAPAPMTVASACPEAPTETVAVDLSPGCLFQSPYLSLQAVGSDGTDASKGILLRWLLTSTLSDHLPKGNLAQGTANFNKPGDFVSLYRAEFPASIAIRQLRFATSHPAYVDDATATIYIEAGGDTPRDLFAVWFMDAAGYASAKQVVSPMVDLAGFVSAYGARPLEVELRGKLALACDVEFQAVSGGILQIETRSVGEGGTLAEKHVTTRRTLQAADGPVARLYGENIRSVRLRGVSVEVQSVAFLCHEDVIADVNARTAWTLLGNFALSLDQGEVFNRLEDPARFTVNDLWRKFDAGARVNVANYQARWTDANDGLAAAVQTYLQLSETDPSATATIPGAGPDDGVISTSYLDWLQITAAADYHVARMLGLGFVDSGAQDAVSYVHLIVYRTLGDLGDGQGPRDVQHLYLSLPTSLAQSRLPLIPELGAVEYGLEVPTGSGVPYALTDQQGYTLDGAARYIRLYPGCGPLYQANGDFFDPPDEIDYSASSLPVLYGVEYRRQSDSAWQKPVIAHDASFSDTSAPAMPEVVISPFPETQRASAFIHRETDPGVHLYAVYGVDLFSRASSHGAPQATDTTVFTRRNSLLPPSDLQVQFIQPESPLVLTTSYEQTLLAQITQADKTLVRFCCNYGAAQEMAYGFADTIELFHRQELPRNVTGGVATIAPDTDPALLRVETAPYTFNSTGQTVLPTLAQSLKANFIDGVLVAGGSRLVIQDIEWPSANSGDLPIFLVRKPTITGVVNDSGANTLTTQDAPLEIAPGDLVMAVENMAAASNWGADNPLSVAIQIGGPNWSQRTESFIRADGTPVTRQLRGVWDMATITPVSAEGALKLYDVAFDTCVLQAHPQSSDPVNPVNWWKGTVRVPVDGHDPEDRRTLKVVQIVSDPGDKLSLRALDDSGEAGEVIAASGQLLNYYPGYLVHLRADASHLFDEANLLPAAGEGSRTTLIGARAKDSSTLDAMANAYVSTMSVPQLVAALEIREPQTPRKPKGLAYATPPDAYGKSSFTLNVEFEHEPFAAVFYRADALTVLASIYSDATAATIRATIFGPDNDLYLGNHFEDLFNYLGDSRAAPDPIPAPGDFAMPVPDAPRLNLPQGALTAEDKAAVKAALLNAFVPLSEQPLIYDLVSTDPAFVPSNRPQTFRDANGDVMTPIDPGFDLSPMAMRPGSNAIRFVDFTLDGSMNPNTLYFYCAREIGNRMQIGEASDIFGPVKLVNLTPPPPPRLRKLTSVPADLAYGSGPRIEFEVIPPADIDPMFTLRIYRTSNAADALSVRSMRSLADLEIASLAFAADGTLTAFDDFSADAFVPFGDPLFYRLAWVRRVSYEDASQTPQIAQAISEPTRTYLANTIDVVNPMAPTPVLTVLSSASNGDKFLRVSWPKVVHNATYYLSRLAETGVWIRLGVLNSNDDQLNLDLVDPLAPVNEDGDPIYYRFKVDVANSSGLLNLTSSPATVCLV